MSLSHYAGVAELADAQDLKSCCSDTVPVRFRSPAFIERALDKSVIIDEKKLIEYVCVAQLGEHLPSKQRVIGSSPIGPIDYGWIPQWPKGADCNSVGTAFEGSNPSPST